MLFSSPPFFLFFTIFILLRLVVPLRYWLFLLIAGSTVFYAYANLNHIWVPYTLLLLAFLGALWLEREPGKPSRPRRLAVVVALLLLPMAFFKYANAIVDLSNLSLPLGISFMTFTMIAYVVDVHRGHYPVERTVGGLAGLVLFFPTMTTGPILRPHQLLPELKRPRLGLRAFRVRTAFGLAIFSVGLLKKLVFADPMAEAVDAVFAAPGPSTAAQYLLAIYGFALQIYCDFSGYTDMAIGLALMLGWHLPTNFQRPYSSSSILEFWRRWHITLSTWLRDYVYISLGGNRLGYARQMANILITMGLCGMWHGANGTFLAWGLMHGAAIAFVRSLQLLGVGPMIARLPRWLLVLTTFHFVTISWILFRAPDLTTAFSVLVGPFTSPLGDLAGFVATHKFQLLLLAVFLVSHPWDSHRQIRRLVTCLPGWAFWPLILFAWALGLAVSAGSSAKFIYFDF